MHAIREQTEDAIAEADLLLLVIDARQGVTNVDQDIALQLRKADKRVVLVVNKAEAANVGLDMSPVYRLGFGEPFLISAEHGQGVGDLLDALLKEPQKPLMPLEDERGVQIAIVGRPNVGKSSLINRILGQRRLLVDNAPVRREMRSTVWYESMHGLIHLLILLGCGSFDRLVSRLKKRL